MNAIKCTKCPWVIGPSSSCCINCGTPRATIHYTAVDQSDVTISPLSLAGPDGTHFVIDLALKEDVKKVTVCLRRDGDVMVMQLWPMSLSVHVQRLS